MDDPYLFYSSGGTHLDRSDFINRSDMNSLLIEGSSHPDKINSMAPLISRRLNTEIVANALQVRHLGCPDIFRILRHPAAVCMKVCKNKLAIANKQLASRFIDRRSCIFMFGSNASVHLR